MKKYLLAIIVIVLLVGGIVVGLLLVQKGVIFNQKASSPSGTATVSLQPAQANFQRNVSNPVSVYFNTHGIAISGITVRLQFSNLGISASGITIGQDLLTSGDWTCPVKSVTSTGSTAQVDIACLNTSTAGYSNNADALLATFNMLATQVPLQNPVIVSFDPTQTIITQKSDATDIALTPTSTGSFTITDIAASPTATPVTIVASPTATPTNAPQATTTATPTATATSTTTTATNAPTPTATPAMPVTGFDAPTVIGISAGGILLVIGALALIF